MELAILCIFMMGLGYISQHPPQEWFERQNEQGAVASLKSLIAAQKAYKADDGRGAYGLLSDLSGTTPPYIDSVLARGKKSGYSFLLSLDPGGSGWSVRAFPYAKLGCRQFWADERGVIRFRVGTPASSADSAVK